MKHFKKLDFVSEEIGFEVNNSRIYKTNVGAFLSSILSIASIIIAIMIGNEVYKRKLPNISVSSDFLKESVVSFKEHPIFFSVSDTNGDYYQDYRQYLHIKAFKMNFTNSIPQYSGFLNIPVHKCTIDDFSAFTGKIDDEILNAYLEMPITCMTFDENFEIKNPYGSADSSFIDFSLSYCKDDNCAEDLDLLFKKSMFLFIL